jgi:hypothetical protein
VRAGLVPGEDHGVQAVAGVVGRTDGVLVIVEGAIVTTGPNTSSRQMRAAGGAFSTTAASTARSLVSQQRLGSAQRDLGVRLARPGVHRGEPGPGGRLGFQPVDQMRDEGQRAPVAARSRSWASPTAMSMIMSSWPPT